MRICSLLPSATEICFALGLADSLVGVSHECDYPAEAAGLPNVTRSNISSSLSSRGIDSAVSSSLESQGTLYDLDLPLLESLRPDLIITQRLCDVCAVSFDRVQEAVNSLPSKPAVLNLEPSSLEDIFTNILLVADATDARAAGDKVVLSLRERVSRVRGRTANLASRPRVFCMEWVDPPYCGGHWMKELVEIAGGEDALANQQRPSYRIEWERVLQFAPEVIVLTCCGFELERCEREGLLLATFEGAIGLPALQNGRIYATDGSHFFSRPGPRIVESLEILAHLIHPELFPPPGLKQAFKVVPVALPKPVWA
ncbi:MAG TPA: cobalamin-binding protein [Terriglobia bacterium]|nr:cobalamin-binding protein [Terriglobia bacterium]